MRMCVLSVAVAKLSVLPLSKRVQSALLRHHDAVVCASCCITHDDVGECVHSFRNMYDKQRLEVVVHVAAFPKVAVSPSEYQTTFSHCYAVVITYCD